MFNTNLRMRSLSFKIFLKALFLPLIIILIIIFLILPVEIPYSFNVPGKVLAAEEWLIIKGRNGELITLLRNNKTGVSKSYSVAEFERGDNAKFNINPSITMGGTISKSDTIGSILSNELELRLTSLKGQLNITHSLLNQSLSGEKESLIKEANDNLDFTIRRNELDTKIFFRQQKLFEKGFISEEEFDISKNTLELDRIAVEVAKAKLQTVSTGVKKEKIDLIKSQIIALEKEIVVLEKKSSGFNLTSPLNGYVRWIPEGDTLLVISDTSEYIIALPIPLIKKDYIGSKANVHIIQPLNREYISAAFDRINNTVEYFFAKPVVLASAIVVGPKNNLVPGLIVECKVNCGSVNISEYLKRIFNSELF